MTRLRGVIPVLPVPFAPDGAVDYPGLSRVADFAIGRGAVALAFGYGSEYFRLTEDEREQAVAAAAAGAAGRVPVLAPCTGESVAAARSLIRRMRSAGAATAVVTPPAMVQADPARLRGFFADLVGEGLPLMVQDAPQWSGVTMGVPLLADICAIPGVDYLKVEAPPTWAKVRALREALGDGVGLFTGYGGLYLLPELIAGADGVMPSAAHPDLYVPVMTAFWAGRRDEATARYERMMPYLIAGGASLDQHVWLQKEILRRNGVIAHSHLRAPAGPPDPFTVELALSLAGRLGLLPGS